MTRVVIVDSDKKTNNHLAALLETMDPEIDVRRQLATLKEAKEYFSQAPKVDLIFSSVQLSDGLFFRLFQLLPHCIPVIYMSAKEDHLLEAFQHNGIAFLAQPFETNEVNRALRKFKDLQQHFSNSGDPLKELIRHLQLKKKERIVVRNSLENFPLLLDDIVLFFGIKKMVYAIDKTGKRYIVDKCLGDLEIELDAHAFFRINRQYIINIRYVKGFKKYKRVKLQVDLTLQELNCFLIVSQRTVPEFRKWITCEVQ